MSLSIGRARAEKQCRWSKSLLWAQAMAHDELLADLLGHPDASRIRSSKLKGNIAALVVDASGLGPDESLRARGAAQGGGAGHPRRRRGADRADGVAARTKSGRGRIGQGRGRQVDAGGQPRGRAGAAGQAGRHDRRRHLRPFATDPARRPRAAAGGKAEIDPGRGAWGASTVDRAARPRRAGAGVARADGGERADPADRGRMGRHRNHPHRPAARAPATCNCRWSRKCCPTAR